MSKYILVIDEGTNSTRAILFDHAGKCEAVAQYPLSQYYPASGQVEHDPAEICTKSYRAAHEMVEHAGGAAQIATIGITNQRETMVAWDKSTGEPLARAIVWQDRRSADICRQLRDAGHEPMIQRKTGLVCDPYFSASKMQWALQNWPALRDAGDNLALGTIDSWLIWKLSGGAHHITDASNASRTMLMALDGANADDKGWDGALCDLFAIAPATLPRIVDNAGSLAETKLFGAPIAITGMAGDQQAALIGQACLDPGQTKATFGTGAFILSQNGRDIPRSAHRLLATISHQIDGKRHYALEGSIFVAGSLIKWLRDDLGLLTSAEQSETLAQSVADNGGVVIVPALSGLGAPHWLADARATISGLSFASGRAHIARAALEAMAHQCHDLMQAYRKDEVSWQALRIDGGMVANDWLAQDLADILQIKVERPHFIESTALGAAILAATGAGLYPDLASAAKAMQPQMDRFKPDMAPAQRSRRLDQWQDALRYVRE